MFALRNSTHGIRIASVLLFALALIAIASLYGGPAWLPLHYAAKPAATFCALVIALLARMPSSVVFARTVALGLVASLVGDILLMLPADLFVAGLLAFLFAHICFIVAFSSDCRFGSRGWPFAVLLVFAALNLGALWPHIPAGLRPPVAAYVAVLVLMASQACARALTMPEERGAAAEAAARQAAMGALLFLASDTLLAWSRFGGTYPLDRLWILATYYAAIWNIARSIDTNGRSTKRE